MSGDAELVAAFETGRVAAGRDGFHHADHVHVAWTYLGRLPLLSAAETFITNLKRFAAAQGKPERYHETISLAYLLLIHDRIVARGRGATWDDFAEANPDLLVWRPPILTRFYSQELLDSDRARRHFVWPDLGTFAAFCDQRIDRDTPLYSSLSVTTGSTRVARRPGT